MEKQFVSYEISKELKDLDFDEPCFAYYDGSEMLATQSKNCFDKKNYNHHKGSTFYSAPLHQQAISFLKIKYNILVAEFWDGWGVAKEDDDFVVYKDIDEAILKVIEIIKNK